MLFKNFFFAFSQAYAASGKKIFISFFLHFIMSIATILGIALISLAARVSLNDDTEFLVRALRVPKELFHGNNIYAIFGVGFAMLMIAVLFSFLGRRVALDIESDVSSYLTDKIRRSITKYSEIYRMYLFRQEIDVTEMQKVISSGVRILGSVVRIGLYQSANLVFLLLTAIILMTFSASVALSLLVVTSLFLFLLYKRSEKAREIESDLRSTKLKVSANCKDILEDTFQPSSLDRAGDERKPENANYKILDRELGRTIGILDSSRLIFGGLLSAYFVLLILYIFLFGNNDKEILFPIIFLVIVVRQYAVSATALGVYLVAISRLSGQMQTVENVIDQVRSVNNRIDGEIHSSSPDVPLVVPGEVSSEKVVFCFAKESDWSSWMLRVASFFKVNCYHNFTIFEKEFQRQNDVMSGNISLNKSAYMRVRKALLHLQWPLPQNFSIGLALEDKEFKPAFIRSQALLMARIFSCAELDTLGCITLEAKHYVQLRPEVSAYMLQELKTPILVFGSWSKRYLDMAEFQSGYFFTDKLSYKMLSKKELYRMDSKEIKVLYSQQKSVDDIPIIDTMVF